MSGATVAPIPGPDGITDILARIFDFLLAVAGAGMIVAAALLLVASVEEALE